MGRRDKSEYIGAAVDDEIKGKVRELAGKRRMSMSALLREQVEIMLADAEMLDDNSETIEA